MLRKLDSIKDCGFFEDYVWDKDLKDLAKINVVYGPNGSGKTSLSGAFDGLRHPPEGEGFKRVSMTLEQDCTSRTTSGSDDPLFDRIHVFSEHYVARSHNFSAAQAEMAAVLTVGERAADAEKQLEALRQSVVAKTSERDTAVAAERTANQKIDSICVQVSRQVVDAASKAGGRYHSRSNFNAGMVRTAFGQSHKDWVELAKPELERNMGIINASKTESLPDVTLTVRAPDDFHIRVAAAIGTTPVTSVLDTLNAHPDAAAWVDEGRHHHKGLDTCIFCGSSLTAERREMIEQHFSDAVKTLQNELRDIVANCIDINSQAEAALRAMPSKGLFLEDLRTRYDEPATTLTNDLNALKSWAATLQQRVEAKLGNVLTLVDAEVDEPPRVRADDMITLRDEHNERVSKHDEIVKAAAKEIELHYLKKAENDVTKLTTEAARQKGAVEDANTEIASLNSQIASLEAVEGDPTPSATVLTEEVARLLGRRELKFEAVGDRYQVTRDGESALGLSAGERTAITLVHFLETVARFDSTGGKPIVIIDDPVSSLDSEVFMGVSTYIWSEAVTKDHIDQLILLTHNFELFRQWDIQLERLHRAPVDESTGVKPSQQYPYNLYQLGSKHVTRTPGKIKRTPVIVKWPPSESVRRKVRSTYHHAFIATVDQWKKLDEEDTLEHRLDAQLLFPNIMRRMLETFLAFKYPESVGNFDSAMRDSVQRLSYSGYQGDANALRLRLTRYTHAYSHNDTPTSDNTIWPDEVKTAIEAVFEFMNLIDTPHFLGMCSIADIDPKTLQNQPLEKAKSDITESIA